MTPVFTTETPDPSAVGVDEYGPEPGVIHRYASTAALANGMEFGPHHHHHEYGETLHTTRSTQCDPCQLAITKEYWTYEYPYRSSYEYDKPCICPTPDQAPGRGQAVIPPGIRRRQSRG